MVTLLVSAVYLERTASDLRRQLTARIQPVAAAVETPATLPSTINSPADESTELTRLRRETATLREELRRRAPQAMVASSAGAVAPRPSGPLQLSTAVAVPVDQLVDAGNADALRALQSSIAAWMRGDFERFMELTLMTEEESLALNAEDRAEGLGQMHQSAAESRATGEVIKVLDTREENPDRVMVEVQKTRTNGDVQTETQYFGRTVGGWKKLPISVSKTPSLELNGTRQK